MDLRKVKAICFVILGVFTVLMLSMGIAANPVFGYIAIGVVTIYGVFHHFFWRCPKCGENMGPLWVKCCPNCGEKIRGSNLFSESGRHPGRCAGPA